MEWLIVLIVIAFFGALYGWRKDATGPRTGRGPIDTDPDDRDVPQRPEAD